jgi:hypothetical protein
VYVESRQGQLIELRAEAVEAMTSLASLDVVHLILELRRLRALVDELRGAFDFVIEHPKP